MFFPDDINVLFHMKHWNQFTCWLAGEGASLPALGRALYSLSLHKLSRASSTGVVSRILPLLLQAGCLADNRALHMSSVLYSAGLGVKEQPNKVCATGSQLEKNILPVVNISAILSLPLVFGIGLAPGPDSSPEGWSVSSSASWAHAPSGCPWPPHRPRPSLCILCKHC